MKKLSTIILAAGKGTRMKSSLVKVLHPILGRPMLNYPIELSCKGLRAEKTVVVIGYQAGLVQEAFSGQQAIFVTQESQLGSGHAVLATEGLFRESEGTILILYGDVPLVETDTLRKLVAFHRRERATLTVATTRLADPAGYGRVVRRQGNDVERIVEEEDASPKERKIDEVIIGLFCVEVPFLFPALKKVNTDNAQGEYYLTDIIGLGAQDRETIRAFEVSDSDQVIGINTRIDLARAHEILRTRYLHRWMLAGVTIIHPDTVYIEADVVLGQDTVIHPNCVIQGKTAIGKRCVIGPNCLITNSQIDDEVTVRAFSVIEQSRIARGALIGPFSRLRPLTQVLDGARIGNFVEVKKSVIGRGSKANHLAYVGDATLGEGVNIGAGTIFCNYDGVAKHPTTVGDGVFVGSNAALIAPVEIGSHAVIGAGSTITGDVPAGFLAVSRARQKNIPDWRRRKKPKR